MANYTEHHASVVVNAPVHQVYSLFSHFNDFPKFMSFVKEVTYQNETNSHWVADVAGRHEWDAVNDQWVEDQQISWHSTQGLNNFGSVTFEPQGPAETKVDVSISYEPPAGILGEMGEKLGVGSRFDSALQNDLEHFARMVNQAPAGGLDPNSSNYLFHSESAAAKGTTTERQNETMYDQRAGSMEQANEPQYDQRAGSMEQANEPIRQPGESDRPILDRDITGRTNRDLPYEEDDTNKSAW
ncbi:MAG TPA: SRPBCC family protein [Ktedonobacteraceae bacterium]|nr:SRPBCC family protein [Ktedonobacteraceae bacterium]